MPTLIDRNKYFYWRQTTRTPVSYLTQDIILRPFILLYHFMTENAEQTKCEKLHTKAPITPNMWVATTILLQRGHNSKQKRISKSKYGKLANFRKDIFIYESLSQLYVDIMHMCC